MGLERPRHRGSARTGDQRFAYLLAGLSLLSGGCASLFEVQSSILYQPANAPTEEIAAPPGLERWWVDVDGGRVEAWYLPPDEPAATAGPAVVYAHGNGERIDEWAERLAPYRAMGLAVLLPEYRGYGRSSGAPSEAAIVADFRTFYDRLIDRPEIDEHRIVFHGRSLGGGVVGTLSGQRPCAALVLESTFTSVPDVASHSMAPAAAIRDRFDTRSVLLSQSTATLILHGVDDTIIPFRHAVELDRVAWDSRLLAFHADHDDLPRNATYWRHVRELLVAAGVLPDA